MLKLSEIKTKESQFILKFIDYFYASSDDVTNLISISELCEVC
jgi:hypothetical protein